MAEAGSLSAHFREVSRIPLLTRQDEHELFGRVRQGDQPARHHIAKANQRLVIKIARRAMGQGMSLDDLIGEANVGLLRAIDKFDPSRNCRFSTYAIYWIRQSVARAIQEKAHTVRPPVDLTGQVRSYRGLVSSLERELRRKPCRSEVARKLRIPCSKADRLERAECALRGATPLSDFGSLDTVPILRTDDRGNGGGWLQEIETRDTLAVLTRAISERERNILAMRYGLGGRQPMTLEEIGRRHNVTRARIGQIEKRAIAKMSAVYRDIS